MGKPELEGKISPCHLFLYDLQAENGFCVLKLLTQYQKKKSFFFFHDTWYYVKFTYQHPVSALPEYIHNHSFIYCLWVLSCYNGQEIVIKIVRPMKPIIFTIWFSAEKVCWYLTQNHSFLFWLCFGILGETLKILMLLMPGLILINWSRDWNF